MGGARCKLQFVKGFMQCGGFWNRNLFVTEG